MLLFFFLTQYFDWLSLLRVGRFLLRDQVVSLSQWIRFHGRDPLGLRQWFQFYGKDPFSVLNTSNSQEFSSSLFSLILQSLPSFSILPPKTSLSILLYIPACSQITITTTSSFSRTYFILETAFFTTTGSTQQ